MGQDSFVFRKDWIDAARLLPREDCRALVTAIVEYAIYGEVDQDSALHPAFLMVKPQIDRDKEKYKEKCEKNRANASKRKAKASETNGCDAKLANASERKRTQANANQRFPKEKERKQEKESFPPTPPFKEKEINKEKENLSPPPKTRAREEDWLSDYFADCNFLLREPFIKALHAENPDTATDSDLRALADETMAEFARQRQNHSSYSDFANHLENLIRHKNRAKAKAKPKQEAEHNAGLKAYVAEQRRLLEAERRRVS